jgi:hypothetical protein
VVHRTWFFLQLAAIFHKLTWCRLHFKHGQFSDSAIFCYRRCDVWFKADIVNALAISLCQPGLLSRTRLRTSSRERLASPGSVSQHRLSYFAHLHVQLATSGHFWPSRADLDDCIGCRRLSLCFQAATPALKMNVGKGSPDSDN